MKKAKYPEISQRIKEIRQSNGLTQAEISIKLDMTRSMYNQIELGNANPTTEVLKKIIDLFNVDANWLIKGHSIQDPNTIETKGHSKLLNELEKLREEKNMLIKLLYNATHSETLGKYKGRKILPLGAIEFLCTGFSTIGLKTAL